jgi:hypothetical protein
MRLAVLGCIHLTSISIRNSFGTLAYIFEKVRLTILLGTINPTA